MALVSFDRVSIAFGHLPLLDGAVLQLERGERVAVVGRNGAGKSTLLRIVSGELVPDAGSVWTAPGLRVARLEQDVPFSSNRTVFDVVSDGLGAVSDLVAEYHRAAVSLSRESSPGLLDRLGRLQQELERHDGWQIEQRVELVLSRLSLPPDVPVSTLSGGWRRRVLLAQALVLSPDVLLLDEPTNHLDLDAIVWLESLLVEYTGTVVFVTHDRTFLQRIATRIVEIDSGRLTSWRGDYATFRLRKNEWLADQAVQWDKFDKRLAGEEAWLRQGIKARRTRNEGRVRALLAMREERAARRGRQGSVRLQIAQGQSTGQLVLDVDDISKSFGPSSVVRRFSTRVMRGDRIGLIGPNGSGKTTLLRLLLGELPPDKGEVRRGSHVEIAYYDQQREQLDPDRTVFDTVGDGNDVVTVDGRSRHVNAYLRDFLFPPERAQSLVKTLSGGERNRLLLARLFTRPADLLVLDEPTNDLDLETLELLEAQLVAWSGTLLLVSHDRAFLDNVVTSTLVFEGDGLVQEYIGGYEDWVRQRRPPGEVERSAAEGKAAPRAEVSAEQPEAVQAGRPKKLSYRDKRELEELPGRIEALEGEQRALSEKIADPDFYKQSAAAINEVLARAEAVERELVALYARWDTLDNMNRVIG
jgi:ATP-binding cassette subfamily F protein uup